VNGVICHNTNQAILPSLMQAAIPTMMQKDEADRLKSLSQYEILDTLPDPALDEITRLAAAFCRAPYAYISFIDANRVWFKSRIGFLSRQQPKAISACQYAILEPNALLIEDALEDYRFAPSGIPLAATTHCRSYIGAPLISPSGAVLGTLTVCSPDPNVFTRDQARTLEVLARQIVTRLELYSKQNQQERVIRSRQRIERALTVERNFVTAVLDTISALVLVLDTAGRIVRFNRACETISGYSFAELVGRSFPEELFPAEERDHAVRMFEQARSGQLEGGYEMGWRTKDRGLRRIAWTATSLTDTQGEVNFVIATGVDVTEQRTAEEMLRTSEARYRQLVEGSLGIICTHDLDGIVLSINAHAAGILGYTAEQIIGTPLFNYIDADHKRDYEEYVAALNEHHEHQGLFYLKRRNGRLAVVAYRNKLLQLPGTEPFVLSHGIDITEQTDAEDKLHDLMRQRESILESVGEGIWGLDMEGKLIFCNRLATSMFGYEAEDILGRDMHELVHHTRADGSPYPAEECPIYACLRNNEPIRVSEEVFWRKDGTSFPVEYVSHPLVHDGKITGIVVAFEDITERRRLERMKDEFISTVSHELRTPLTSLSAALNLIAGGVLEKRPEKQAQMMQVAVGNCDRLVRLVNDILDFERVGSGRLPLHRDKWDAIDLLRRAAELQQSTAGRTGITFRIDAQPLSVFVDGDRVQQTITNLIGNAVKFSPRGSEIRLGATMLGDDQVVFEVEDHGRGIPPDKLELIFERFEQVDASDSRTMGGTGLGLAICRAIVAEHGGRIWAESKVGEGSTFFFSMPLFKPEMARPKPEQMSLR
jgi:two-component system sensor histidine kinase VicK